MLELVRAIENRAFGRGPTQADQGLQKNYFEPPPSKSANWNLWDDRGIPLQDAQKASFLTRPTPAVTSPARPESAKTASSPRDAPCPMQGRSFSADLRFTFHASRFTAPGSDARTKLADFFSILLELELKQGRTSARRR